MAKPRTRRPSRGLAPLYYPLAIGVTVVLVGGVLALVWWNRGQTATARKVPAVVHSVPTPRPLPALPTDFTAELAPLIPRPPPLEGRPALPSAPLDPVYEEHLPTVAPLLSPPPVPEPRIPTPPSAGRGGRRVRVAVVIDDLGHYGEVSKSIARLPADLTLAILPETPFARQVATIGRESNKEIILHQPMEPTGYPRVSPGGGAIYHGMATERVREVLEHNLAGLPEAVGINNHMGSRATTDRDVMTEVMRTLAARNLYFLDSRTSPASVGYALAEQHGVPRGGRDIFLDNVQSVEAILGQLLRLEEVARARGEAVAIGHPYPATLAALERWLPEARARGIEIVRASQLLGPAVARPRFLAAKP